MDLLITVTVVAGAVLVTVVVTKSAVLVSVTVIVGASDDTSATGSFQNLQRANLEPSCGRSAPLFLSIGLPFSIRYGDPRCA